jgi:hypothetical protein
LLGIELASCQQLYVESQAHPYYDRSHGIARDLLSGRGVFVYKLHGLLSKLSTIEDQQPQLQDIAVTGRGMHLPPNLPHLPNRYNRVDFPMYTLFKTTQINNCSHSRRFDVRSAKKA